MRHRDAPDAFEVAASVPSDAWKGARHNANNITHCGRQTCEAVANWPKIRSSKLIDPSANCHTEALA